MKPTIKDIAEETGFSYATVSRALNNKYGVKPGTRDLIMQVAQSRGYTPNGIARGLVKKQTYSIGLIIPDISNPFFPEVTRGIEERAKEKGYSVFLCNTNYESDQEARYLQLLIERRVDGIILASGFQDASPLDSLPIGTVPIVSLCTRYDNIKDSFVIIDNERGGFIATKHLIEQGYPTIGFIGAKSDGFSEGQRYRGYRQALDKFNIPFVTTLMGHGINPENESLFCGGVGMHGSMYGNYAVQHSDLLIALGTRFSDRIVGIWFQTMPYQVPSG